ncbi:MAG: hypothetical protein KBD78_16060 [Oligoflexales bacterium]|nr:hypothetical protein [Oligoflexales bacterium]
MFDLNWITAEAQQLHGTFQSVFYVLVATLLVLGIILEYFRLPLGGMPATGILVGRALVAIILLVSYREVVNTLSLLSEELTKQLGSLDTLSDVLQKFGDKVDKFQMDWLSARSLFITGLSILTYVFLLFSVIVSEAAHAFTLMLLYVFSPLLIALFVLPQTSGATKGLYRTLIEVSCWKVVWAVLANLLWASVLVEVQQSQNIDFVKMVCINLMLGSSLLATPWIVHALATAGLSGFTRSFSGIPTIAGLLTAAKVANIAKSASQKVAYGYRTGKRFVGRKSSHEI